MIKSLEDLTDICRYVFKNFLEKDFKLIKNRNYEPTVSGRMAMYFREKLQNLETQRIFIDVEYNKYKNNEKLQNNNLSKSSTNKAIRPDIIIHQRNTEQANLIYCELKKSASRNGKDKNKVEDQVKSKNYKFGLYINKIKESEIQFQIYTSNIWFQYSYMIKNNEVMEITHE